MPKIRNVPYRELKVGDEASIRRTCTEQELILFAHVSGNTNPLMLPDRDAATPPPVAPSMWIGSLISAVLGTRLPGPGTLYRGQTLRFGERVRPGDVLDVAVRCIEKGPEPTARFETRVAKADGTVVCEGVAEVDVPTALIETDARHLPELILDQHDHFAGLIDAARRLAPLRTAVVNPDDRASLGGALLAARNGLIQPVLVGPATAIRRAAESAELDLSPCEIVDVANPHEAARRAIELVNEGGARAVMKGNVHSDELLVQIVRKEGGLRGPRRISHAFLLDVPTLDHLLIISDAAINIAPDLVTKVDIVQNAIDLAIACGLSDPRVGILSAVETVNPNIPSTLDAAILSKMAERGQIRGGVVDGPLAMDNAIDIEAARTKGIASLVAGRADILIVPNLEAGNMLAKELTFVARAEAAGLVLGAKVPIMLTSRADNERARLASAAVAQLYDYWRREGKPFGQEPHLDAAAE
jgi:phosphotransacetylase/acyl dehydratase